MERQETSAFWCNTYWPSDGPYCSGCGTDPAQLRVLRVHRDEFLYCAKHRTWCRVGDGGYDLPDEQSATNRRLLEGATEVRLYDPASEDLPHQIREQMKTYLFNLEVTQILNAREHRRETSDLVELEAALAEEGARAATASPG